MRLEHWYIEWAKRYEEEIKRAEEEIDRIKAVQKSIRHPHFVYAVYDMETGVIEYKRKKWHQWFSGKRVVRIKIKKTTKGLENYATVLSNDGKQRR